VTKKLSHREIAILISKHHGTVSREVKRNKGLRGYRPKQAQEKEKAEERLQDKRRFIKLTAEVQVLITENIYQEWSPDQIQGQLKSEGLPIVCATTIYGFIQQDKASGGDLYKHLSHRKRYKINAQGHLMLEARLSGVDQSMKDRPLLMRKSV
jgi:IS30 family transposase